MAMRIVQLQQRKLLLKKWLFEFSRYSAYILHMRWRKAKLLMPNFFGILYGKNIQIGLFVTELLWPPP